MTTGWRFPLAAFGFAAWYALIVADTIGDAIIEHRTRKTWKAHHGN